MRSIDCVGLICRHYGIQLQNTPVEISIIDALKICGFLACEIQTSMKGLTDCPMPAIVETTRSYMVIIKANNFYATIIDPADGKRHRIAFLDFVKMWTGIVVVIEPPPVKALSFFRRLFS